MTAPLRTPGPAGLVFVDDDGEEVALDESEAATLIALTGGLDGATVSACPSCRCRVLAVVALADVLESGPPHPRSRELIELAEDAPTLHVYVVDSGSACRHQAWRDPGYGEWAEAVADAPPRE